ncbi:hypothetical protein MtrunA17_Chr3g0083481 [Medicago truncatula]|uniref:Transmembrane protein n=1 Tax=Medicago truncatula TaxID=3880 RepID=A0A396IKI5_MEDTR|nr:hypothetical protein MtrunA17_Chr3g0083481 [Medicago truncatula]
MANSFFFSILMLFLVALMFVPQGFANTVYFKTTPTGRSQYTPRTPACDPNNRAYSCLRGPPRRTPTCERNSRAYPCRRGGPPTHL